MQTPEEFLESNGLATRSLDRAGLIAAFQKEMEAGLAGEPSSLKMIPTFTSPSGEGHARDGAGRWRHELPRRHGDDSVRRRRDQDRADRKSVV